MQKAETIQSLNSLNKSYTYNIDKLALQIVRKKYFIFHYHIPRHPG